jgi:MinD-like ATPase involved in chromosome partitioning or flagellar assembly
LAKIVAIHSYRGGTGKSNLTANVAALLASQGARLAVIDTDIQSPGIHAIFGMDRSTMNLCLNDFLWGRCPIERVAYSLGNPLVPEGAAPANAGQLYLIPASMNPGEITRILREGYDVGLLNQGLTQLVEALKLDYLLIDTHPGLNEETLLSMAIADLLFLVLRPDRQDYQGSAVTLDVARKLEVPNLFLIVNKVLRSSDFAALQQNVEKTFRAPVAAIVPLSEEMLSLGSSDLFCREFPDSPVTQALQTIARLTAGRRSPQE